MTCLKINKEVTKTPSAIPIHIGPIGCHDSKKYAIGE